MAEIDAALLVVERATDGTWSMRPADGEGYVSPVSVRSNQAIYGSPVLSGDFAGVRGMSQRFQATVSILNLYGMDGMDGLLQSMFDEVDIDQRFDFRWPQMLGTDFTHAEPRLSANAKVGDNSLRCRAGTPLKAGRLIKLADDGKLHRVTYAPSGAQGAAYSMGIAPSVTDAVTSGGAITSRNVDSKARFTVKPLLDTVQSVVLQATITVQEARR